MKSIVLQSVWGGGWKTALTFNLVHMAARQGLRTMVLDCDPQCSLSDLILGKEQLSKIWETESFQGCTVAACVDPVLRGGEILDPLPLSVADNLWLLPGHLRLSRFEQTLAEEWPQVRSGDPERAPKVATALEVLSHRAAAITEADLVLLDIGPSLGALNRSALLACDAVAFPLTPDLFGLESLKTVGPSLWKWRRDWLQVREQWSLSDGALHSFEPIGYIVQPTLARAEPRAAEIPTVFHEYILGRTTFSMESDLKADPQCIARLTSFAGIVPLAQIARKPLFDLKMADGVGSGQVQSVAKSGQEFENLVREITHRLGLTLGKAAYDPAIPSLRRD